MAVSVMMALAMGVLLAAQAPDDAALERIRHALETPAPALDLTPLTTDFYVFVEAPRPFADVFELPPWVTPPSEFAAPRAGGRMAGGSIDPGVIAHSISKAVRTRRAHTEVIQAIVEYCAAHRDEPGASGICGGQPR
jgi:hypothetical protein